MKIKLLTLASVAAMGMSVSLAGGPVAHQNSTRHHVSGVIVGVDAGMVYSATLDRTAQEWAVADGDTYASTFTFSKSHAPWTFGLGGILGYQIDHHWALEFGYDWHQKQKAQYYNTTLTDYYTLKSHNYYFAVKGMLPIDHEFSAYLLAGVARTSEKLRETYSTGATPTELKENFWSPMAGVGVSYDMGDGFHLNLQYEFVGGLTQTNLTDVEHTVLGDSTQAITIGVDYLFDM